MKLPPAFVKDSDDINVIVETPQGANNKNTFDPDSGLFKLSKILPEGLVFPHHFGFIPNTKGDDDDPLDVLILMDTSSYPGLVVECRVIGVIEAEQTERSGETMRNDRIIAVAKVSRRYTKVQSLKDLDDYLVAEVTKFFITYNEMNNKRFVPVGYAGPLEAVNLIRKQLH